MDIMEQFLHMVKLELGRHLRWKELQECTRIEDWLQGFYDYMENCFQIQNF